MVVLLVHPLNILLLSLLLLFLSCFSEIQAFIQNNHQVAGLQRRYTSQIIFQGNFDKVHTTTTAISVSDKAEDGEGNHDNKQNKQEDYDDQKPIVQSVVKIDDGGSDMTDRFKYKVNALMGVFDPQDGSVDDENSEGNILNAMLKFPAYYTFNIVGKTLGDVTIQERYIQDVKQVISDTVGIETDEIQCQIIPRGKNFIKVQCEVEVHSVTMINTIYDDIGKLENTKMRF